MAIDPSKRSRLETLSIEIFYNIIDLLTPWDVKDLSRASKRVRELCLLSLFRCVEFPFSNAGFDGLTSLTKSDTRYHVVSLTYTVPQLLKTEILDFNRFKSDLLTLDSYVETAKDIYDANGKADECPSYMRSIVNYGVDRSVLSFALGAFSRLTNVRLSFCETIEDRDEQLSPFISNMTIAEESYEYHVRVVSDAIQSARNKGIVIHTISLSGYHLPYYYTWEIPDLSTLSESLRKLLESVRVLCLIGSSSSLELLSHCALDLHELDMCHVVAEYDTLQDFLETNKRSIRSIGFHDVEIIEPGRKLWSKLVELSSSMLCEMLKVPQFVLCRAADCGCLRFWKEGRRLLLKDDHLSNFQRLVPNPS
ncbi:hypothetical protein B0J14DRAFT_621705 [Halenospora varia]|nr:hypothetical protein B0J14DRAFT_621705 [Halenospora varia]